MDALTAYIDAKRQPFDWMTAHCLHYLAGWVAIKTGHDAMAGLPATPSRFAAYRVIAEHGGMVALLSAQLGSEPISPRMASVGDAVLIERDGSVTCGICAGRTAVFLHEGGEALHVPMSYATHAWRLA